MSQADKKPIYIMCLDDEEGSLEFMGSAVEQLGYTPLLYSDVASAIKGLHEKYQDICLIIADFRIGDDHTGIEVRRATKDFWAIPFVVMSGYVTREMALEGLESKIDGFYEKPADLKSFVEHMRKLISGRLIDIDERRMVEATFFAEAHDILQDLESQLIELEHTDDRKRSLDHIFRLVHTLKGSSAAALTSLVIKDFAHAYEDLLGKLKIAPHTVQPKHVDVLIKGKDIIQQLIEGTERGEDVEVPAGFSFNVDDETKPQGQLNTQAQNPKKAKDAGGPKGIRVSAEALDEIEYLTAETTIQRNMISKLLSTVQKEMPQNNSVNVLTEHFNEMSKLQSAIQAKVGMVHTVSFSEVVRPLSRVVRDLERQLSKTVAISVVGESLRIDHMTEKALSDCLVHIVRNAMDHGIEEPAQRESLGKPARGKIEVKATEDVEKYYVCITDDGRGIDRVKVKGRAVKNGLYTEDEVNALTDDKLLNLIFAPGFSTADKITDVSGRGVGTDMVKTTIENLGGRIKLVSKQGEGTEMTLVIPKKNLSVSMISVLVRVGSDTFAIPQSVIYRLVNLDSSRNFQVMKTENSFTLDIDDQSIPIVCLENLIHPGRSHASLDVCRDVMICSTAAGKIALAIDAILDSEEVVVRPLKEFVNVAQYFKGAALFDDGRVGLVLDPETLAKVVYGSQLGREASSWRKEKGEDLKSYLLLESLDAQFCAIRQTEIYRIEEFPLALLRTSFKKSVIIYRDLITPVQPLNLGEGPGPDISFGDSDRGIFIITEAKEGHFIAHRVKQVIDIFEAGAKDTLDNPLAKGHGEGGFIRRDDQLFHVIVLAPPRVKEVENAVVIPLPLPPKVKEVAVEAESPMAWGMFE